MEVGGMTASQVRAERFRWAVVAAAAVVGVLHVQGALQVRDQVYRGYRTGDDRVVTEVSQGGPADRAGLRVGDRLTRVDGIDARDRQALDAQPRPRVGQTVAVVVDRGGRSVEARVTLSGLPPMGVVAYLASGFTGLSFLGFGLWAYLRAPGRSSRLLVLVGIGVGAIFTEQPYVASRAARAAQESGLIVAGVFGFAVLLHFMLVFPRERPLLARTATLPAIYAPAAIGCAGQVTATIVQRGEPGGPVPLATTFCLVLVLAYFALATAALVQGYLSATRAERTASGLTVLVVCVVLGLVPLVPTAVDLVVPGVVFPGGDYYDLTWVLIPFALARATVLTAKNTPGTIAAPHETAH
jgi:hypothetical protein